MTDLITLSRARVQQALEALDVFANAIRVWPEETWAPHEFAAMDKGEAAITALRAALEQPEQEPARQRFDDTGGREEPDPVERLRFFCSLAMNKQDWLDVEAFFDDVLAERQKNAALEQLQQATNFPEEKLQAIAEYIGDKCHVWYSIGARDVEEVLRQAAHHKLVAVRQHFVKGASPQEQAEPDRVPVKRSRMQALSKALGHPTQISAKDGDTVDDALIELAVSSLEQPEQGPVADRAAFERHAESLGYSVDPDTRAGRDGGYWSSHTHLMWETWQAALEQPVQDPDRWGEGYEAGYAAGMAEMKPEQADPVAVFDEQQGSPVLLASAPMLSDGQPLYTRPPSREWVGLTEQEPELRELLIGAAAMAAAAERKGVYQGASWVADAVLARS